MADSRERWALILGGSSGMGEATARALAAAGYNICGIHLDFRAALQHVEELKGDLKKMEMTQDVMANSLVYWVQDLYRGGFLGEGSKVYAMTSEGSSRVVPSYGVVSSAKAALESHVRQLAMELGRLGSGVTVNAIRAGVTKTPALMKIPEHDMIIAAAKARNPTGRMTTTQDVADAIVALSGEGTGFISGEVIGVDGGEFVTGS